VNSPKTSLPPRPTIEEELDCDAAPIIPADYVYGNFFDPQSDEMEVDLGGEDVNMFTESQGTLGECQFTAFAFLSLIYCCRHSRCVIAYPAALWGTGSSDCSTGSCSIRGHHEFRATSLTFRVACRFNTPLVLANYFTAHELAPPSLSPSACHL